MKTLKDLFKTLALITLISSLSFVSNAQAKRARDIAEKAFPSVVMLIMQDSHGQPTALGSGFFVKEDVVATNLHVIEGAASGYAKIVGKKPKYDIAGFVAIDRYRDLVLLKLKKIKAPTLTLGDSNDVSVGDEVYAIGNPQGLEGTFSKGIVSSIRKVGEDSLLQITAPISPGSSGGAVLNTNGEVIGVSVATFSRGQNLNFAIPVAYLKALSSQIKPNISLSDKTTTDSEKASFLEVLGERSTEGVVCDNFLWDFAFNPFGTGSFGTNGRYSFSVRNRLQEPIADILCLVMFHDREGKPIDFDLVRCRYTIPAGLAKRTNSRVDSSVQKLTTDDESLKPSTAVVYRILDFKVVESEDLF